MALFCIIKHDREGENPASNLANKAEEWRLETGDRRGGDNQIKGKWNKEKNRGFERKKESGRRWLLLGLRFENKRMWDLLLLGLIWGKGKGKGKGGIFVRLTGWRGEDWEKWEDPIVFVNFVKLGKLSPSLPSLTDFNWVWSSLLIFEFSTQFHMIYLSWLVKSYDFTSQLASLITMATTLVMPVLTGLTSSFRIAGSIRGVGALMGAIGGGTIACPWWWNLSGHTTLTCLEAISSGSANDPTWCEPFDHVIKQPSTK